MTLYKWSQTASSDATADSTINWAEGMAPSQVNDSSRGMMAATAKYRDDIAGAIVTTGSSTAYLVSSYQQFDTLAHLDKMVIAFTPHITNTGSACTLNLDSLGAKPLRSSPAVELLAGTIIQGTPYLATYNNTDGAFYLQGFYSSPYSIPLAATIDYWAATAPNSAFAFPFGQAIDRTVYAKLFALVGTSFGAGNGSTTFQLPDLRGCTTACPDNMGGSDRGLLAAGGSSLAGVRFSIGGSGGVAGHVLTAGEIPSITSSGSGVTVSGSISGTIDAGSTVVGGGTGIAGGPGNQSSGNSHVSGTFSGATATLNVSSNNTSGQAHDNMQPTVLCNKIMRIL